MFESTIIKENNELRSINSSCFQIPCQSGYLYATLLLLLPFLLFHVPPPCAGSQMQIPDRSATYGLQPQVSEQDRMPEIMSEHMPNRTRMPERMSEVMP